LVEHADPLHACFTRVVGADIASVVPAGFDAVTTTRIDDPKSSAVSVYVASVAPATGTHASP
jgi:hypothetical protein